MGSIFNLNSPLMTFLAWVADIMILSLLWLVCCIPVLTIGPATSALYYVMLKKVRGEDALIVQQFFHSLKENLIQGLVTTTIFILAIIVLVMDYLLISVVSGTLETYMKIVFLIFTVCLLSTILYTFPLQAQFKNSTFGSIRNAFFLSLQRLPNTIGMLLLNLVPVFVMVVFPNIFIKSLPIWTCLAPGVISYICAKKFEAVFERLIEHTNAD